jgi:protoporphyrinogen oxidase
MDNVQISNDIDTFDAIILGAGISGLVAAAILLKDGCEKILVVDEYDHIGGNHIDRTIGPYTFDIGSFIFQDDSPLLAHLPELLPLYTVINPSWGRLNPQGVVTKYPISIKDDIVAAGPIEWSRILLSVLFARFFCYKLKNARDFARYWIGARLLNRSGLEDYMERFYGLPAEKIDLKFAEKRMLWIKEHASFRNPIFRWPRHSAKSIPNQQLARPREGFSYLYRGSMQRLERCGTTFVLGTKIHSLRKERSKFYLEFGSRVVASRRIISTIPIERTQNICNINICNNLNTVTLMTLFFSFHGHRGFNQSILYNFSHDGPWKRLTMYSDFYGPSEGREFFGVEINADHVSGSVEIAEQYFRQHVSRNGLFSGDLRLEGSHILPNAYPIYTDGASEQALEAISALRTFGIESIGRQGRFDYQPTARDTTLKAEAALRPG